MKPTMTKYQKQMDSEDITARYELVFPAGSLKKAIAYGRLKGYTHERDGEYAALLLTAALAGIVDFYYQVE